MDSMIIIMDITADITAGIIGATPPIIDQGLADLWSQRNSWRKGLVRELHREVFKEALERQGAQEGQDQLLEDQVRQQGQEEHHPEEDQEAR